MIFKRDENRETNFETEYGFKPEIWAKYEINPDFTWKVITLKFKYKDREWDLVETYRDCSNMTDHCTVTGSEEVFDRFIKAEHKLVELMREIN